MDTPIDEKDWESEEFEYTYGDKFKVKHDVFTFGTSGSLEKLSISFALAQCVKLSIFENHIESQIESNKDIPEAIANHGHVCLSLTHSLKHPLSHPC